MMKPRLRHIRLLTLTLLGMLLMACHNSSQQAMPMQQTMDSLKMWYGKMQRDSMDATAHRVETYLQQHANDQSAPVKRLRAEWLKARGVYFAALRGELDSGIVYTERALKEMEGLEGVGKLRILAMHNRADFYRQQQKLDISIEAYLQALHTADSLGLSEEMKIPLLLGISTAYTYMGDFQDSGLWWKRTGELLDQMNDGDRFIYYNDLGNDHYFQHEYEEARECFTKAAALVKDNEDRQWDYYTALANLGETEVCLGHAQTARMMIAKADSFFRKVDFQPALYYLETEKIGLALLEKRLKDALQMVRNPEFKDIAIPAAKLLRLRVAEQVLWKTGNSEEAYRANLKLDAIHDSIQHDQTQMQKSALLMEYQFNKLRTEQRQALDNERTKAILAWALLVVALLAVALLVMLMRQRNRRQRIHDMKVQQQIVEMRMENTRNRITPHFIYNALSHEMLAQMEGRPVNLGALTQLLRRGVDQAGMLQTTLEEELTFVDYYVGIEAQQMGPDFEYVKEIADDVDVKQVNLPSMMVQIFVENAIKHGLRRQGGLLTVRASRQGEATLVEVIDNGRGLSPTYQENTGLRVVRQTIQLLNEHNRQHIAFGVGNLERGCRSWLLLPDHYDYNLKKI